MSLMLLATLKIMWCLKNYCYHNHDNTYIVKLLCLAKLLHKHVLTEFEYQVQLGVWHIYWINYKLQVPKWILIKCHEISVKHSQLKVKLYDCSSHHHILTISETDLELHSTTFSWVCSMRLEWSTSTAMYCVTMSPHFQINMSVHYVFLISDKVGNNISIANLWSYCYCSA